MNDVVTTFIDTVGAIPLARKLGVTPQFVYKARRLGYFPPARADEIERIYGTPRQDLVKPSLRDFIKGSDT